MWDEAQDSIYTLMATDCLPRFYKSSLYADFKGIFFFFFPNCPKGDYYDQLIEKFEQPDQTQQTYYSILLTQRTLKKNLQTNSLAE